MPAVETQQKKRRGGTNTPATSPLRVASSATSGPVDIVIVDDGTRAVAPKYKHLTSTPLNEFIMFVLMVLSLGTIFLFIDPHVKHDASVFGKWIDVYNPYFHQHEDGSACASSKGK
jgi:hypothetical protein